MKPVFADTFYWIALLNPDDAAHDRVVAFDVSVSRPPLVTTEEILIEFLTFFCGRGRLFRVKAVAVVQMLKANKSIRVCSQTHETFASGLAFYANRPDKRYSMTDCISMQTMRREGMTGALTTDRHFEQEGFHALFRSAPGVEA